MKTFDPNRKLVFLDVDGTLFDHKSERFQHQQLKVFSCVNVVTPIL